VSDVGAKACIRGVHLGGRNQVNRTGRDKGGTEGSAQGGGGGVGTGVRVDPPRKRGRPRKGEGKAENQLGAFERAINQMLESRTTLGASALEVRQAEAENRRRDLREIIGTLTALVQRMGPPSAESSSGGSSSQTPEK
jgi:hypothetical protein